MIVIPVNLGVSWIFWKVIFRNGRCWRTCWFFWGYCCHSSILVIPCWIEYRLSRTHHQRIAMENPAGKLENKTNSKASNWADTGSLPMIPAVSRVNCAELPGLHFLRIQVLRFLRRSRVVRTAGDSVRMTWCKVDVYLVPSGYLT